MRSRPVRFPRHLLLLCLTQTIACSATVDGALDDENASFLDGKGDVAGWIADEGQICAVLKTANQSSFAELDDDAGLNALAARAIHDQRVGADGQRNTDDDGFFASLRELDDVKFVGPFALSRLAEYAETSGVTCGTQAVQLLAFNDFHGNLEPPSGSSGRIQTGPDPNVDRVDAGGVEYMATHLAKLRGENANTLVVAAGDIIGASPLLSSLFHDEPAIEAMNLAGLDVASVGNHEFDEGVDELLRMQSGGCHPVDGCGAGTEFAGAEFSYLAANVTRRADGSNVFPAVAVRSFGQARIAFIGLTLEGTPLVTVPANVSELAFADEVETINTLVPEIRALGIETIVVLIHEGGAVTGLYDQCEGMSGPLFEIVAGLDRAVDVVVAGHTNAAHICDLGGILATSAASFGRLISDIDLSIDELTGEVTSRTARNVIVTRDVEKAAEQSSLIAKYATVAAPLANRVVARIGGDLLKLQDAAGESVLGNAIADSQLAATREAGARIALMNPGGMRADLLAATVSGGEQVGEVTYGEAFSVQPFGNTLVTLSITGEQLLQVLEAQWRLSGGVEKAVILQVSSTLGYAWDPAQPIGARIVPGSVTIEGAPLDPAASYRVTMNAFLADGGDGFATFREGLDRVGGGLDLDAFTVHLAASGEFVPPALGRIRRIDG